MNGLQVSTSRASASGRTARGAPVRFATVLLAVILGASSAACGSTPATQAPTPGVTTPATPGTAPSGTGAPETLPPQTPAASASLSPTLTVPPSPSATVGPVVTARPSGDPGTVTAKMPAEQRLITSTKYGEVPANQIIVMLDAGLGRADADALAATLGGSVVGQIDLINAFQIETSGTTEADLLAALAAARATPGVTLASTNQGTKPLDDSEIWGVRTSPLNDGAYAGDAADGYGLIGVQDAWNYIRAAGMDLSPVKVGIVDTGLYAGTGEFGGDTQVEYTEPGAQLAGPDAIEYNNGTKGVDPSGGHGTSVATIIGGDPKNGGPVGIASGGLGKNLTISNTNVFGPPYSSSVTATAPDPKDPTIQVYGQYGPCSFGDLAAIMAQVKAVPPATVINLSWGAKDWKTTDPELVKAYRAFFAQMANEYPNVVFVAAAGNDGQAMTGSQYYPAGFNLPNIITVGNVNNDGTINSTSNTPGTDFEVSVYAPGDQAVRGIDPATGQVVKTNGGTSMAAPQVTATLALLRSLNPDLSAEQLKKIIATTSRKTKTGTPVIAVDEAVRFVIDLNADLAGKPRIPLETLKNGGVVDAVAKAVPDAPGEWAVRAIVQGVGPEGADVAIAVKGGKVTLGATPRSMAKSGEIAWTIKTSSAKSTVTVTRQDNGAGSVITLEQIDINGTWSGTLTFTALNVDKDLAAQISAEEGCSLQLLDSIKGRALPLTLDITEKGGKGKATMVIDMTAVAKEMGAKATNSPIDMALIYSGNFVTFTAPTSSGQSMAMSAVVKKSGDRLTMTGSLTIKGKGYSAKAVWATAKSD